ncbi:MAG: cytidine deaminase [Bacteroidia bacterium]
MCAKTTTLKIETEIDVYIQETDLSAADKNLVMQAKSAIDGAYAPYSNYHVGAAVLLENGEVVTGNNQENAAYPSGLCAERVAVFYASAKFPNVNVKTIAIITNGEEPAAPCGACRQAIAEYEALAGSGIRILMAARSGKVFAAKSIESLLPLMFNRNHLK